MELRTETVSANDVEFAYLTSGPGTGPMALCLHGFPDSAHTWRLLAPTLVEAGYRVVAPFLRGYAPTAVPADGRYQTGALAKDAVELHEALAGDERAVVIGHDWGATAAYGAASLAPERWRRVVTASVPPAGAMSAGFLTYDQLRRSWYMFFFQHPLAELVVGMDDLAVVDRLWADWSPGYDATEDL
ncbi:MAG: alpha/beta fold hydrolase, partial [Acidimicrobiales bacterium]